MHRFLCAFVQDFSKMDRELITLMMMANFRVHLYDLLSQSRAASKVYIRQISQHRLSHAAKGAKRALLDSRAKKNVDALINYISGTSWTDPWRPQERAVSSSVGH